MLLPPRTDRSFRRRTVRRAAPPTLTVAALVLLVLPITGDRVPHSETREPGPRRVAAVAARMEQTESSRSRTPIIATEGRSR
jgi:hypothetical protein